MHLFNKIIKLEDIGNTVSDYNAKKIIHDSPKQVHKSNDFSSEYKGQSGSFRMDELLQERTGIGEKRQQEVLEKVEEGVIERLQEVETDAYKKAYDLGFEEGTTQGLKNAEDMVSERLDGLNQIMEKLFTLRKELVVENEAQIVRLSYILASKIAMRNIEEDPAYIIDCIQELIDSMQTENDISLKVSFEDFSFIEEFKNKSLKAKELFSKVKVFKEENLNNGECILDSNHGIVNATMEERLNKLWATLSEGIPKIDEEEEGAVEAVETSDGSESE